MTDMTDNILADWHGSHPHSFSGKYHSLQHYKDLDKKTIEEAFTKNDIYTKFYQFRKPKFYNPTYVYRKRELWQADVVKFPDKMMMKATGGTANLLVIIDVFTKMVWAYPLKKIDQKSVASCFRKLFKETKPERLATDSGTEFKNGEMVKVCHEFNVNHFFATGITKAAVAERVNLSIQQLIYKRCKKFNTDTWTSSDVLDGALETYRNRYHSTIKMSPMQAEDPINHAKIRRIYVKKYAKVEGKWKKPKFKVGDTVRISKTRSAFHRGYYENFTTEVWRVKKVLDNLPYPRYIVEDERGEELINNILNENELVKYVPSTTKEYLIDYIVSETPVMKLVNGKKVKCVKVRWKGYTEKFDTWEPAANIRDLLPGEGV